MTFNTDEAYDTWLAGLRVLHKATLDEDPDKVAWLQSVFRLAHTDNPGLAEAVLGVALGEVRRPQERPALGVRHDERCERGRLHAAREGHVDYLSSTRPRRTFVHSRLWLYCTRRVGVGCV